MYLVAALSALDLHACLLNTYNIMCCTYIYILSHIAKVLRASLVRLCLSSSSIVIVSCSAWACHACHLKHSDISLHGVACLAGRALLLLSRLFFFYSLNHSCSRGKTQPVITQRASSRASLGAFHMRACIYMYIYTHVTRSEFMVAFCFFCHICCPRRLKALLATTYLISISASIMNACMHACLWGALKKLIVEASSLGLGVLRSGTCFC